MHEDGSYKGVYMRIVGPAGQLVTAPVQVNQYTANNQRDPAIAALAGGGFIVVWVSETEMLVGDDAVHRVRVYARVYNDAGAPVSDEFALCTGDLICANPSVAAMVNGGFIAGWLQRRYVFGGTPMLRRHFLFVAALELTTMTMAFALAVALARTPPPA